MYPRARQANNTSVVNDEGQDSSRNTNLVSPLVKKNIDITDSANMNFAPSAIGSGTGCYCDERAQDEEQKENMMAEVHITYEKILQLE